MIRKDYVCCICDTADKLINLTLLNKYSTHSHKINTIIKEILYQFYYLDNCHENNYNHYEMGQNI